MKVIACMPVYGRRRLLSRTITRLYEKNKVFKVICAGNQEKDKRVAQRFGATWVQVDNYPLGHKWNEAFAAAKKYKPDACLFIGSSDWLEDDWLPVMEQYINDYDIIGVPDFTMCDIRNDNIRVGYWPGYPLGSNRDTEAVGGGRLLSRRLLEKMNWRPFDGDWDNSMDYSMRLHAERLGARALLLPKKTLVVLAMSSDKWINKHNYDREMKMDGCCQYSGIDGVAFLSEKFPEALTLFDDNKRDFYADIMQSYPNTAERTQAHVERRLPNITLYPTRFCSHGCWYCCSKAHLIGKYPGAIDRMGAEKYTEAVLSLSNGHKCEYRFSGGEALQHHLTAKVIDGIFEAGHEVCLGTNGVHIKTLVPVFEKHGKKVRYEASFHLGQYLLKESRAEEYLKEHLPTMLKYCREMELVIPLTPLMLTSPRTKEYLSRAAEIINSYGFNSRDVFNLTELGGVFDGRTFPVDYTQEEKNAIANLHTLYGKEGFDMAEIESEAKINRSLFLNTVPCFNMTRLFQVGDDGNIWVCGAGNERRILGNIEDAGIASKIDIGDEPKPCGFLRCVCPYLALNDCLKPRGMNFTSYNELKEKHGV